MTPSPTDTATNGEKHPLLASPSAAHKYYFLNKQDESYEGGTTPAVRDGDGGLEAEFAPPGTTDEEFAPRPVQHKRHPSLIARHAVPNPEKSGGFLTEIFGGAGRSNQAETGKMQPKLRKAPVKVEPKVYFANERTFLAWLHLSIILAGASIAILAFVDDNDNPFAQLYGVVLLPVAIAFIIYSMYQYRRRSTMIRNRHPGPYEDTVGPVVLGIMLMISIVAQFALKVYTMSHTQ